MATGAGLTGGPITGSGTISLAAIGAGLLFGNSGTASAVGQGVTLAANLTLSTAGTLGIATGATLFTVDNGTSPSNPIIISGNTAVPTPLAHAMLQVVGKDTANAFLEIDAFGAVPTLAFRRWDGTEASPTGIVLSDILSNIQAHGWNGTVDFSASSCKVVAAESWNSSSCGAYQTWSNTGTGTVTDLERMRLTSQGALLVGTTAAVGSELLNVNGIGIIGTLAVGAGSSFSSFGSGLSISAGALNLASIATQTLLGNTGTATAVPGAVAIAANMTILSGGTLATENQGTITLVGTTTGTVTPAGLASCLVNVGTANGTISVSSGSFHGQALRLEVKQGATPHTVSFDTTVEFGTDVTSYTATNTANLRDLIQLIWQGSFWMFAAVNHGFV